MRYFLNLSFKGTSYHGWQVQDNAPSIQAEINKVLSAIYNTDINVVGCGRTDTGVHAKKFYAHFDLERELQEKDREELQFKLNKMLPTDIAIHDVIPVTNDASARYSAISRTYKYFISRTKDPFNADYSYYYHGNLDVNLMNEGANILYDYEDFTSFSKLHTQVKTNNCKIMHAEWEESNDQIIFTITSDRFLRNMVRAIVGTLLDLGRQKITLEDVRKIIESKDRSEAGFSVPAQGLFLYDVKYPDAIILHS
jgi:tRNA pseudouridine38-40 synthase